MHTPQNYDIWFYLFDTLSFAAKGTVVFVTIALSALAIAILSRRGRQASEGLEVRDLNDHFEQLFWALRNRTLETKALKKYLKEERKAQKKRERPSKNIFVLDFTGDMLASATQQLRQEVSAILGLATKEDEVLVRIESPGGVVHGYGFAASQLRRIRDKDIRLVASVDKIAASGGYMMACVADHIIAAPFAVVGSIGVAAPVPNAHRLLERHGVDYDEMTAGEFKRTVSLFGKITDKGRAKFQEQLDETHTLFRDFVGEQRPTLDMDKVATGEYWHGIQAQSLGLVDTLQTSDDFLLEQIDTANIHHLNYKKSQSMRDKVMGSSTKVLEDTAMRIWSRWKELSF
jgi:serine protease SohB